LKQIRDFVKRQNIKYHYDIDEGGCHQLVVEQARILPGQLAVSTSAQCPAYGCLGALGIVIDKEQMAGLWSSGQIEMKVPPTVRIQINGKTPPGVYTKDIALFMAQKLAEMTRPDQVIEYYGPTVSSMSISERFTLAGMAGDLGVLSAVCPFDSMTRRYLLRRSKMPYRPALADKNADYVEQYEFNVDQLHPMVARPGGIGQVEEVANVTGLTIDQVIIGTCTNGRFDDLRIAADILKGKKVSKNVRLIIVPSSREVYLEALKKGLIRAFLEVGAAVLNPGCGFCDGGNYRLVASGERCLVTGSGPVPASDGDPEIYLVSPATAAASALKGVLTDPTPYVKK
jgi:homoaconitase/3-isopropylmalate dehydratase large subunit